MSEPGPWGVARGWWSFDGTWNDADPASVAALEAAQGAAEYPQGPPPVDPIWFVIEGVAEPLRSPALIELDDGGGEVESATALPPDLPLGAHLLRPLDGGPTTRLFVVPAKAPRPARGWGWSAQLYGVRSRHSWGHGDLVDLGDLARWAADGGASLVAHNPLGATLPISEQQPSPYFASSRRFLSPLYLRVESVIGADLIGEELSAAAEAGRELSQKRRIDRNRVWELKLGVLEQIWHAVRDAPVVRRSLVDAARDDVLTAHATFCALAERHGAGWTEWPAGHRDPSSGEVAAFRAQHSDRVDFWRWLQLECDIQLEHAASTGAGLMGDLPVGFDPSGSDAWMDQDQLATGCRVGAPPDELGPQGQDWGLPPYIPWKVRASGYSTWIDTLRRSFRHASSVRIDHVMGLFRLYWIPEGADPTRGAYVYQFGSELLDLAVMEAARAGATLVGEDLGTVEPEVREAMGTRDVFGYRIGWFEDDPPVEWPSTTLGSITTHDLPTVAGAWTGVDAALRLEAGLRPDPEGDERFRNRLGRLARLGGVDDLEGVDVDEVNRGAHRSLAAAGSDLVLATLEDAVGVREWPNVPGTVDERPNWRLALPVELEELDGHGAADITALMQEGRS
jgi:4-alpha-glucanotransferase